MGLSDRLGATVASAEADGATLGVAIVSPEGERFSHNGQRRFVAASTVKIAIMVELFRRIDAGEMTPDDLHVLLAEEQANGSGVLRHLHAGLTPTLGDLAYLMMSISDNTATNILIDRLGIARIQATMRALGMQNSTLGRRMHGRPALPEEADNWAVPDEYAAMIAAILQGRAASQASCEHMVALLELQQNDRRIARHLPRTDRPRWGTKTGSLPDVANDVGFVITARGPLILAIFTRDVADPHQAEAVIGDVARAAFGAV